MEYEKMLIQLPQNMSHKEQNYMRNIYRLHVITQTVELQRRAISPCPKWSHEEIRTCFITVVS